MSYSYNDYLNYYKNNNIVSDSNFEDNMICVVDIPSSYSDPDSLKFVKCKNFLDNNPSHQITIARPINSVDNTPYDFYAVMPKTYQSYPIVNDPLFFTKLTIANIPKSLRASYTQNMTPDQKNNFGKENWTKASNIYCKYQPDYNSCINTFMNGKHPDTNKENTIKPNYDFIPSSKNNFGILIFIIFLICIFLSLIIFLLYKNKFY
jgi:hypothetical protein